MLIQRRIPVSSRLRGLREAKEQTSG